ncbi:ubiD operon protein [Natrialba sp. SSL1]|uniref:ubiD operon protein n=1 Tax=Natrialba sp. SSL1 TaxID=1869245 RepID=UPI0008F90527|nr:ubiD operon protein [Natrialba sp. SSL1]OIB55688.1 ubiD operon protein [Natrialba sp. SSL1]
MANQYVTAAEHVPEDATGETVTTLQLRDPETKEIFEARVRLSRTETHLEEPHPLSVVSGPHETTTEQWYVEFVDRAVDEALLESLASSQRERSNVLNTRSDDLKVLLEYLVETGRYESSSAAIRELLFSQLAEQEPALLDTYDELRTEYDSDPLREALERTADGNERAAPNTEADGNESRDALSDADTTPTTTVPTDRDRTHPSR